MKAVLCPVCNGAGQVSGGFFDRAGDCPTWATGDVTCEVCRSCNGKGWVEVHDESSHDISMVDRHMRLQKVGKDLYAPSYGA